MSNTLGPNFALPPPIPHAQQVISALLLSEEESDEDALARLSCIGRVVTRTPSSLLVSTNASTSSTADFSFVYLEENLDQLVVLW